MMKNYLKNLLCLLCLTGISYAANAVGETEPNGLWNQAKQLTLAATGNGTCTATGDQDWWRVKSGADGKLTVNFTSVNALSVYCTIYDTLGTVVVGTATLTNGSSVINVDGLAAGSYYILFNALNAGESPAYSFVPTWTNAPVTIDAEPNGTKAQAKTLPVNGSKTGHVGYYFNNKCDTVDWYKVTTTGDGQLKFTLTTANGQTAYAQLYDNNGVILLAGGSTNSTQTWTKVGLATGNYFIAVSGLSPSDHAAYTISDSLIITPVANDPGPNEKIAQAVALAIGDSTTGHMGYYYNQVSDSVDWYKITTLEDGTLNYDITYYVGFAYYRIYDHDGLTDLSMGTMFRSGLAAGTYYLAISKTPGTFAPCTYKLKISHTPAGYTNDTEPNGTRALAKVINPNDSITGHIGFYYNLVRDTFDYRKVTITGNGKLEFTVTTPSGTSLYAKLYDNNATTFIAGGNITGTSTFSVDGLAPGTYYFIIDYSTSSAAYVYTLKTKFTPVDNDTEPNGTSATAKALVLNDSLRGNISYYYNNVRDTSDWFSLATNNDGQLNVKLYSLNGKKLRLNVYDNNKTTVLFQSNADTVISFTRNDLGKGTYYVRVRADSAHHYAPYALTNKLTSQLTNDVESNRYAKNSVFIGGYTTKTGHLNYYYKLANDTTDWYKIKHYGVGNLVVTIVKSQHTFDANYPDFVYQLYGDTLAAPIATNNLTVNTTFTFTHNGLVAGNYYIKLSQLNNTFGAYTLTANYQDTASATIALTTSNGGSTGSCGTSAATYFVTRGVPPYSVQLYLDGVATGSPVSTNDTAKFTLLTPGAYSATVKSTGAITKVTASTFKGLIGKAAGNNSTSIQAASAVVIWNSFPCADGFQVSYKKSADASFTNHLVVAGAVTDTLKNLLANTSYDYKIQAYVQYNGVKYYGAYTTVKSFTTLVARTENIAADQQVVEILIYPNPAMDVLNIRADESDANNISITDATGRVVLVKQYDQDNQQFDVSALAKGFYTVALRRGEEVLSVSKFIKQ